MRRIVLCSWVCLLAGVGSYGQAADKPAPHFANGKLIDLKVEGRAAYLIVPTGAPDPQRRWVWIAPFWLGNNLSGGFGAAKPVAKLRVGG